MNNTPQNRFLWKFTETISKIGEILFWIGTGTMVGLLIFSFVKGGDIIAWMSANAAPGFFNRMNILGCTIGTYSADPAVQLMVLRFWAAAGILGFGLFAMMFRDAFLILRTIQGKTKFAEGETPFQKPVVRMIREIGIFLIALPVCQMILQEFAYLMIPDSNISVTMMYVFLGFLMLCLSQCFERGVILEKETEGLI